MENGSPQPFTVTRQLVVKGGWLTKPWVVDVKVIGDGEFVSLSKTDRDFAKAMGMDLRLHSPFGSCSVFAHLQKVRNDAVDAYIMKSHREADPMADGEDASSNNPGDDMPWADRGREKAFQVAHAPESIPLVMEAFVTSEGDRVPSHTIKVVTTPRRNAHVTLEATPDNFNWLFQATHRSWNNPSASKENENFDELPCLDQPCKYMKTPKGKIAISCCYRCADGAWRRHQKIVGESHDVDQFVLEAMVRRAQKDVLAFYGNHHVPLGDAPAESIGSNVEGSFS